MSARRFWFGHLASWGGPLLFLTACVQYEALDARPQTIAAEVALRRGGEFTLDAALARALRDNPELRALDARARAAGAATTVVLPLLGEWRGRSEAVGAMLDPIALLGLGPRGAAIDAARAEEAEAVARLAVARWRTLAEVAKVFRVAAALMELEVPEPTLDVDAFVAAGLASTVGAHELRALQARATAERVLLETAKSDQRTRLLHLLGLARGANVRMALLPTPRGAGGDWLAQPVGELRELIERPDLALASAQFEVADAEFRRAIADQYPSLQIGPNVSLRGDPLRAMSMLNLPLLAYGRAQAAGVRREAARADIEDRLLEAQREATLADDALRAARSVAAAAAAAWTASRTAFAAARAALEVEPDAFGEFVRASRVVLRVTAERRQAMVALASAEVERAAAYGWPVGSLADRSRGAR